MIFCSHLDSERPEARALVCPPATPQIWTNSFRARHRLRAYDWWLHSWWLYTRTWLVMYIKLSVGCLSCEHSFPPLVSGCPNLNRYPLIMKDDNDGACSYNFFRLVQVCGHVPRRENLDKTKPIEIDVIILKNATNRRYKLCWKRRFPKRSSWNSEKRKEQDLVLSVRKIFLWIPCQNQRISQSKESPNPEIAGTNFQKSNYCTSTNLGSNGFEYAELLGCVFLCCVKPIYWGIVTVPGSIPYDSRPGVAGSSPSKLTTSLAIPVPSSSSSNGPTTVPLTTMGLYMAAPSLGQVQSSFGLTGESPKWWKRFLGHGVPRFE